MSDNPTVVIPVQQQDHQKMQNVSDGGEHNYPPYQQHPQQIQPQGGPVYAVGIVPAPHKTKQTCLQTCFGKTKCFGCVWTTCMKFFCYTLFFLLILAAVLIPLFYYRYWNGESLCPHYVYNSGQSYCYDIDINGNILRGNDAVEYFGLSKDDNGVEGDHDFEEEVESGVYAIFRDRTNKMLFSLEPNDFLPHYGGYCAYAMANGMFARGHPDAWDVVDGKLYMQVNKKVRETFRKDPQRYIKDADKHWREKNFDNK